MIKIFLLFLTIVFFVSGCGIKPADSNALPAEDGAKEITVEVYDLVNFFEEAAKAFEKETGVKVKFVNDYKESMSGDSQESSDRITAELMAGKGADIYGGFFFDFYKLGSQNHLCDLAEWISKDSEVKKEDYYMPIINTGMVDDKMYAFPVDFWAHALYATVKVAELEGQYNLTWEQFFEKTKNIKRNGILYLMYDFSIFKGRFIERAPEFIDEKSKTYRLNTPEFIQLLKQCKDWGEQGFCMKYSEPNRQANAIFQDGGLNVDVFAKISTTPGFYMYDLPSDTQNSIGNEITVRDFICINKASKNKGTAWKFVKFLLSENIQSSLDMFLPVNRKAAVKNIDKELRMISGDGIDFDMDKAKMDINTALDSIQKVSDNILSPCQRIVTGEARRYYLEEVSLEEAVKNITNKVELYLKEQI